MQREVRTLVTRVRDPFDGTGLHPRHPERNPCQTRTVRRLLLLASLLPVAGVAAPPPPPSKPAPSLREAARRLGLAYPLRQVHLRAFKAERTLELWAADRPGPLTLVRRYPVAALSGGPGPKRREGDGQVPEGVYRIDRFNPKSRFHLSLGLDYPNASDRLRGDPKRPGGDIFIHGNAVSIGCLAMTDPLIDEIYPACFAARNRRAIPVHLFPCRMDGPLLPALLQRYPQNALFWKELRPIDAAFRKGHVPPNVRITRTGAYRLSP